nr:MAG TPA: hypothetical protein [Caudoviricetes sp.]
MILYPKQQLIHMFLNLHTIFHSHLGRESSQKRLVASGLYTTTK